MSAFNVFAAMGTQWIVGPGGVLGLNYAALDFVMSRCGVKTGKQKDDVFPDIRIMEEAALEQMRFNK